MMTTAATAPTMIGVLPPGDSASLGRPVRERELGYLAAYYITELRSPGLRRLFYGRLFYGRAGGRKEALSGSFIF